MKSGVGLGMLFCALFALVPAAQAANGDAARARFEKVFKPLAKAFPPGAKDVEEAADRAVSAGGRLAAFNLQGLTRIYKKLDPGFNKLGKAAKALEDAIGQIDKWESVQEAAIEDGASEADLARIQKRIDDARAAFVKLIVADEWIRLDGGKTVLDRAQKLVAEFEWPTDAKDRDFVLGVLDEQAKKVRDTQYDTQYDMGILENGDGLHELRRELRWFTIEGKAADGLLAFAPDEQGCPLKEYQGDLVARILKIDSGAKKYLTLPDATADACLIPRCLFLGVVLAVTDLGKIKDQVERLLNETGEETDVVPPKFRKRAEDAYALVRDSGLLGAISDRIRACRK
jgi:hypothetical protein